MLIALLALLLHLAVVVVLHPRVVDNGGSGRHRNGDLLLLTAELGYPGTAIDTGTGSVVEGSHPDEAGVLTGCIEVLEVVGIDDGIDGCDGTDSHNAADKVICLLERLVTLDNLQHLLLNGLDDSILLADKTLTPVAALRSLIVAKFTLLRGQCSFLTHIEPSFSKEIG